jgi:hypothetical protein
VDFAHRAAGIVLEADGFEFHGTHEGLVADCGRYDELVALGWRAYFASVSSRFSAGPPGCSRCCAGLWTVPTTVVCKIDTTKIRGVAARRRSAASRR